MIEPCRRRRLQTEAETCEAATTDSATCEAVMRPNYAGERMCGYTDYAAQTGWPTDTSHASTSALAGCEWQTNTCACDTTTLAQNIAGLSASDQIATCPKLCKGSGFTSSGYRVDADYKFLPAPGDCSFDGSGDNAKCKAGCVLTTGVAASTGAGLASTDTAGLADFMLNVSVAWKNRTKHDSVTRDLGDRRGALARATGRCESAVQDWAMDKSCEQEHAFVKEDSAGKPRIPTTKCGGLQEANCTRNPKAGCKSCRDPMIFNEGFNSLTSGVEKADCIEAMFALADPVGTHSNTHADGAGQKICDRNAKETACQVHFTADASCGSSCADCTSGAAHCDAAVVLFKQFHKKMRQTFCQFTDKACQAKLKEKTENDLGVIAIVGGLFCVLFLAILYFTYRGVLVYMGGDDDDE